MLVPLGKPYSKLTESYAKWQLKIYLFSSTLILTTNTTNEPTYRYHASQRDFASHRTHSLHSVENAGIHLI